MIPEEDKVFPQFFSSSQLVTVYEQSPVFYCIPFFPEFYKCLPRLLSPFFPVRRFVFDLPWPSSCFCLQGPSFPHLRAQHKSITVPKISARNQMITVTRRLFLTAPRFLPASRLRFIQLVLGFRLAWMCVQ